MIKSLVSQEIPKNINKQNEKLRNKREEQKHCQIFSKWKQWFEESKGIFRNIEQSQELSMKAIKTNEGDREAKKCQEITGSRIKQH